MFKNDKLQRKREAQFSVHRRLAAYWQRKGSMLHCRPAAKKELAEDSGSGDHTEPQSQLLTLPRTNTSGRPWLSTHVMLHVRA